MASAVARRCSCPVIWVKSLALAPPTVPPMPPRCRWQSRQPGQSADADLRCSSGCQHRQLRRRLAEDRFSVSNRSEVIARCHPAGGGALAFPVTFSHNRKLFGLADHGLAGRHSRDVTGGNDGMIVRRRRSEPSSSVSRRPTVAVRGHGWGAQDVDLRRGVAWLQASGGPISSHAAPSARRRED
jgi:hypothetical protein